MDHNHNERERHGDTMVDDSTTTTQPSSVDPQDPSSPSRSPENDTKGEAKSSLVEDPPVKKKRPPLSSCWLLFQPLTIMLLFYCIGIVWHTMHPMVSVFTGQTKPRRLYIDENSLEISYFRQNHKYPSFAATTSAATAETATRSRGQRRHRPVASLCAALQSSQNHHHHHHHHSADSSSSSHPLANSISCHCQEGDGLAFDVAQILPSGSAFAIEPHQEALVLVVPATPDWNTSLFHLAILHLLQRLSRQAAWLAKKILIVAPVYHQNNSTTRTFSLHATVDLFLDAYLGSRRDKQPRSNGIFVTQTPLPVQKERLPFSFRGAILRQLIVLDNLAAAATDDYDDSGNNSNTIASAAEIRILPGGRRGVLPNMDLTSMVHKGLAHRVKSLATTTTTRSSVLLPPRIVMHLHKKTSKRWKLRLSSFLSKSITPSTGFDQWLDAFFDLILFEYSLLSSIHENDSNKDMMLLLPPHAEALDRGIDSLTIQTAYCADPTPVVETMEVIVRSLSNLHERLHHSTALYLLTSAEHFVKHEEYLVPNLLVIIPLLVRVLSLLFVQLPKNGGGFDWRAVQKAICFVALSVVWIAYGLAMVEWIVSSSSAGEKPDRVMMRATWSRAVVALPYLVLITRFISTRISSSTKTATSTTEDHALHIMTITRKHQSLQFVACLMAIYIHIPIAFGHVSLAFPSALFWSPLLAFVNATASLSSGATIRRGCWSSFQAVFWLLLLCASRPFALIDAFHIFSTYTPYVKYAYIPLHLMASMTWLCPL
jgi:GPI-anchor transamidase subunit GAA1